MDYMIVSYHIFTRIRVQTYRISTGPHCTHFVLLNRMVTWRIKGERTGGIIPSTSSIHLSSSLFRQVRGKAFSYKSTKRHISHAFFEWNFQQHFFMIVPAIVLNFCANRILWSKRSWSSKWGSKIEIEFSVLCIILLQVSLQSLLNHASLVKKMSLLASVVSMCQ